MAFNLPIPLENRPMRRALLAVGAFILGGVTASAVAQEASPAVAEPVEAAADAAVDIDPTPDAAGEAAAEEPSTEALLPEETTGDAPEPEAESEPAGTNEVAVEGTEPSVSEDPAEDAGDGEATPDEDATEEEAVEAEEAAAEGTDWAGIVERAPAFLALTHHAAVHLPIALWLFGALFVVIGVVVPSWRNQIPLACLIGGMLTSVAAAATGWWYAQYEYADEWAWGDMVDRERLAEGIVQHRWLAVALVIASVILSVIALISQAKQSKGLGFVWRVGLLLLAAAVSYEGHVGGELIMGEGFLEEAFQEWVNPEE